jgi:hypothetical protein
MIRQTIRHINPQQYTIKQNLTIFKRKRISKNNNLIYEGKYEKRKKY